MSKNKDFLKNQEVVGLVEDLTSEGLGVIKIDGFPLFVEGALIGETVKASIMKATKNFGFARLIEIENPSPDRREIIDPVGRQVGTMSLQHMSYEAQLNFKHDVVEKAFKKLGGFDEVEVRTTIGMDHPWEYRNKAQIPTRMVNGQLETGFFRKNSHDLIPVENFYIQHPEIDRAIAVIKNIMREFKVVAYNEATHKGVLRHIIVRRGHYSGEMMVILVINEKRMPDQAAIAKEIRVQLPEVVSVMINVQDKKTNVIMGPVTKLGAGQEEFKDQMMGHQFRISAQSFYQVNTPQAEVLYREAIKAADIKETEVVLDAYCGIGTLSLSIAEKAKEVYAMEVVPQAIEMAKKNAAYNYVDNVTFEIGKAEDVLPQWNQDGIHFDVVVMDPPRKGLEPAFVESVIEQGPDRIAYVSCNPATCARDCRLFADAGYKIEYVQPVDMFPQTVHVETVVLMTRVKG